MRGEPLAIERIADWIHEDAPQVCPGDLASVASVVAWSVIVEPGDVGYGILRAACGSERGYELLLHSSTAAEFVDSVAASRTGAAACSGLSAAELRALGEAWGRWRPRTDPARVRGAIAAAGRLELRLFTPHHRWPQGLSDLGAHQPVCLWARGRTSLSDALLGHEHVLAVVGARAATAYGEHCAFELTGAAAREGALVLSGGAYGIDGAAHRAALALEGSTIAVLAGGVDRVYPRGHERLFEQIMDSGVIVSEVPPGTAPTRWRFLARNRVIAAWASATLVVEAGSRSGALNTAHHALELGRPLGAVPGPITSATSRGCHRLIQEYAASCVTDPSDVEALLGKHSGPSRREDAAGDLVDASHHPERTRVWDALSLRQPRYLEQIVRSSGVEARVAMSVLGELEIAGAVISRAGGWVKAPSGK